MICPFCNCSKFKNSVFPPTFFNDKIFNYITCNDCDLIYLTPFPTNEDYVKMYPPSYQNGISSQIIENPYKKLIGLRFSYGYQFELMKKFSKNLSVLDYGCGNANFLINANHYEFQCDGVEFSPSHVEILKKEIPHRTFYTTDQFLNTECPKYDIIRLSNVLEHLTDPRKTINELTKKMTENGIFLIEGPIETNFNLAFLTRKIYFTIQKIKNKKWTANHVPTHIFLSNSHNQRSFFESFQFQELHYEISEAAWPYPNNKAAAVGIINKIKYYIAKLSIALRPLNKKWGNTFIYIGRIQ